MARREKLTEDDLWKAIAALGANGTTDFSMAQLLDATEASRSAVKRIVSRLEGAGRLASTGAGRGVRYHVLPTGQQHRPEETAPISTGAVSPVWSSASVELKRALQRPLATRAPVTYQRQFVDDYTPNQSFLLPQGLADDLTALGRLPGQLPAGTYVRKVLEQLLIDLSWSSSHLEGNRYSLLDTEELFKSGAEATDSDAVMLLNHKAAIEFLADAVPSQGLSARLIRNLHAVLMRDLLVDVASLGAIRQKVVNISATTYVPTQMPAVLEEIFETIVKKAQRIKNPMESAFFLWVNLAYLQPFEDGNKRVSRLAANVPLMLYNQAPLSFLDVDREEYALAMMGVYEKCDVSMAVDLFAWTYRRSQAKYNVVLESMGSPDPIRIRYRQQLNTAVEFVVRNRKTSMQAVQNLNLPPEDESKVLQMLEQDLGTLSAYNFARYRLTPNEAESWIQDGRPK